jgi:hypothetical protein
MLSHILFSQLSLQIHHHDSVLPLVPVITKEDLFNLSQVRYYTRGLNSALVL